MIDDTQKTTILLALFTYRDMMLQVRSEMDASGGPKTIMDRVLLVRGLSAEVAQLSRIESFEPF